MIKIEGLTKEQVAMLDEMWACDSMDEIHAWMEECPEDKRPMANVLWEMLILASIDEDLEDLSDARNVLINFI